MEFLGWLVLGAVVAVAAAVKGFGWFWWLVYGLLVFPVALVHVLVKRREDEPAPVLFEALYQQSEQATDAAPAQLQ